MWPTLKRLVISLVRVSFAFLKIAYMYNVSFRYTMKIGLWRYFLALWWEAWFHWCLTWYVKSWHGSFYGSLAVLLLKFISELYRFWFMYGYYLLIKHLHGNMTRFSTWDRGVLGWLLVVVLFAPIWGGSLGICFVCWMLCTALYGSTSLQQSSKGSCSLLVSGYNLRADCQWRTLVPPLNSGANAAPASVPALM